VEDLDHDFPFFTEIYSDTYHLVGDTPDYTIHAAVLEPNGEYLIRGVAGASTRFNFTTQGPRPGSPDGGVMVTLVHRDAVSVITGMLDDRDVTIDAEGRFEIRVSREKPRTGDWLPMGETTSLVLVRNEFHSAYRDHWRWSPTKLQIERIGRPDRPCPLSEGRDPDVALELPPRGAAGAAGADRAARRDRELGLTAVGVGSVVTQLGELSRARRAASFITSESPHAQVWLKATCVSRHVPLTRRRRSSYQPPI
jgi:hypothetical protein